MVSHGIKLAEALKCTPRRILVIEKRTRLVREQLRHPCYLEEMQDTGRLEDRDAVQTRHNVHKAHLREILNELKKHFSEVEQVDQVDQSSLDWADVFVSAGGDGTFLNVASQLKGGQMLIGLNTDPDRSHGYLCARSRESSSAGLLSNNKYIISRIATGTCQFIKRRRICVKLTYPRIGQAFREVDAYALNDVYVGETSPTRMSYMELNIDDLPPEKQKSSGLLICTGSGSTAWGYHVNGIDAPRTERFMSMLHDSGLLTHKPSNSEMQEIMLRFNESFVFDPNDSRIKYIVREPLDNNKFGATYTQGFANSINVRSLCWNGKIVMDGIQRKLNFDDGVVANFSTNDEDSINSIQFVD